MCPCYKRRIRMFRPEPTCWPNQCRRSPQRPATNLDGPYYCAFNWLLRPNRRQCRQSFAQKPRHQTSSLAEKRRATVFFTGTRSMSALADAKRMAATHTTRTKVEKQTGSSTKNLVINFLRESATRLQPPHCADAPYQICARKCIKYCTKRQSRNA